jgi:hypothetical protein
MFLSVILSSLRNGAVPVRRLASWPPRRIGSYLTLAYPGAIFIRLHVKDGQCCGRVDLLHPPLPQK